MRCPPSAYDSQAQRRCQMRPWLGQEVAFRELSPRELGHSRVEENGLPPCLTVCVCDRYEDRGAFPSICVGKCEGIGVRRNRESPTRVAWLACCFAVLRSFAFGARGRVCERGLRC